MSVVCGGEPAWSAGLRSRLPQSPEQLCFDTEIGFRFVLGCTGGLSDPPGFAGCEPDHSVAASVMKDRLVIGSRRVSSSAGYAARIRNALSLKLRSDPLVETIGSANAAGVADIEDECSDGRNELVISPTHIVVATDIRTWETIFPLPSANLRAATRNSLHRSLSSRVREPVNKDLFLRPERGRFVAGCF
jgi:hypothetical protein